jgi:hypothetical protein
VFLIIAALERIFNRCMEHSLRIHKNFTFVSMARVFSSPAGSAIIAPISARPKPAADLKVKEDEHEKQVDWI